MIAGIVLAAGRSQRMGTQKLLLPWHGATVVGHVVNKILAAGLEHVVVVVGADRDAIAGALGAKPAEVVTNPDPGAEMLGSVRCGLSALPGTCEAALVCLGDQPGITAGTIEKIVAAHRVRGKQIIVPSHDGLRGHPILIPGGYFGELLTQYDGVGMRGLLQNHADHVCELPVDDPGTTVDIDTPEDYWRELER